jgi:hypothetical protein
MHANCPFFKMESSSMNKQDLVDAVASKVGIAKSAAAETIDAFLASVTSAVVKGEAVQLIGLGMRTKTWTGLCCKTETFPVFKRAERAEGF